MPDTTPSIDEVQGSHILRTGFRVGGSTKQVATNLGLLAEFQGNWRGKGFNITARPFFKSNPPFFLEINATDETLDFTAITGPIPNRGSIQPDVNLFGLRYLQQVIDCELNSGIHIEPGIWLHVPATTEPPSAETYVRQSTIPHGDSLLAQSTFFTTVAAGPQINPVNSTPFKDAAIPPLNGNPTDPITDPVYLSQYVNGKLPSQCLPPGLTAAEVLKDPTVVLRAQIAGQNIKETIVIQVSTAAPGSLVNIPFVNKNANAAQLDAIFWLETVEAADGRHFMQLQYVQRVILSFIGIQWPHISVATLVKL